VEGQEARLGPGLRPVAQAGPPRLEVGTVRAGGDLAVGLLAGEPDLDVVGLRRREAHVARREDDDAVREAEAFVLNIIGIAIELNGAKWVMDDDFDTWHCYGYAIESPDFRQEEFESPLIIEELYYKIINDINNLPLNDSDNLLLWLNDLLTVSDFYDRLLKKSSNAKFSDNVITLANKTEGYREKEFSSLKEEEQYLIKILNRLLLEDTYPQQTPKSHIIMLDQYPWRVSRSILKSPYSREALRYYDRALALKPDDQNIRENAALAAYSLGKTTQMKALENDATARSYLGYKYADMAKGATFYDKILYYQLALSEYKKAIDCDSNNIIALNGYAYTFWQWRLTMPYANPPYEPGPSIAHDAEKYARKAVMLAEEKLPSERAIYYSTLGEVLLGQARAQEAIEVLEEVHKMSPKHAMYDELRWDLMQSYLCAAHNNDRNKNSNFQEESSEFRTAAVLLSEQIRQNEKGREFQRFTSDPELLDTARSRFVGHLSTEFFLRKEPDPTGPLYKANLRYSEYKHDKWLGVICDVDDMKGKQINNFKAHIWGGGVDRHVRVGKPYENVFLSSEPLDTHDYYFAQLEDKNGKPISTVYTIPTYKDNKKNLIELIFCQQR